MLVKCRKEKKNIRTSQKKISNSSTKLKSWHKLNKKTKFMSEKSTKNLCLTGTVWCPFTQPLKLNQIEKDAMTAKIGMWRQWTHEFCNQRSIDK